ncbi:MAG: DUF975 family protein [Oscillospiraceae bacterium]|jgi:uncharacterized membrane protein|nr:DUF975 family protein [Oscillospiraceae bacterium]
MPTPAELKARALELMKSTKPSVYGIAAIFTAVMWILGFLANELNHTRELSETYMSAFNDYVKHMNPELFVNTVMVGFEKLRDAGSSLISILPTAISSIISVGFVSYCLKFARAQTTNVRDLLDGFTVVLKLIIMYLLIGVFVALWSLLFIIPGVIASLRYSQAIYILLDDPSKGALQCITESKRLMRGHKGEYFWLLLTFLGWTLLSYVIANVIGLVIPIGYTIPLLAVFLSPYSGITRALYYNELKSQPI